MKCFPRLVQYVEMIKDDSSAETSAAGAGDPPRAVAPVIPGFEEPIAKAEALYDFPPGEAGDLPFNAGDTICITEMDTSSDWYGQMHPHPNSNLYCWTIIKLRCSVREALSILCI